MLTNRQKQVLHVVAAAIGLRDEDRRLIQANVGGFYSAADRTASQDGFVAVMAFFEKLGGGELKGYTAGYWAGRNGRAETHGPADRIVWRIRREQQALELTDRQVDEFLRGEHMSGGRASSVQDASIYWLRRLLDGLKAIKARQGKEAG